MSGQQLKYNIDDLELEDRYNNLCKQIKALESKPPIEKPSLTVRLSNLAVGVLFVLYDPFCWPALIFFGIHFFVRLGHFAIMRLEKDLLKQLRRSKETLEFMRSFNSSPTWTK